MYFKYKVLSWLIIISGLSFYFYNISPIKINKDIKTLNLGGINKLMIVAHPDDEMLWGGLALLENDYLVVCITCGSNKYRVKEFKKAMEKTNDSYLMLGYPDKKWNHISDWKTKKKDLKKDLKKIIDYKE